MDWIKLFKSKPKLKADPRVRWFGKLPSYPDYYSSHVDEEWAVEFNDWIMKGFELYQGRLSGADKSHQRLPVSGMVVRLPKSGMTVLASLFDYGGDMRGRPFPLIFYTGVPSVQWPGPTSDRVGAASSIIQELTSLRSNVTHFLNSPGRFESSFGDRQIDLDELAGDGKDGGWSSESSSLLLVDWFDQIGLALGTEDRCAWLRAASAWGQNLATHESDSFEPTIRLPLAMGLSLDVQIAGWIRWLESSMNIQRRFLSLLVTGEPGQGLGYLTVIAREPIVDDFLLLTSLAETLPYLDDLTRLEIPADTQPPEGSATAALPFEAPDARWLDFVNGGVKIT